MNQTGMSLDAQTIAELNDLLQLDHDAVEAYTIAINLARGEHIRETLAAFRKDHKRHIDDIADIVRRAGALPVETPHATGALKMAVQTLGAIPGDDTLLLAFKAVEGQARDKYQRMAAKSYPEEVRYVIMGAAQDEEKHYQWVEGELNARNLGGGTLPHTLASAVEGVHKVLANPIERAQREVMNVVGSVVGTTHSRGGSVAPSPEDAAKGAALPDREAA
jgi:rubrerythrin